LLVQCRKQINTKEFIMKRRSFVIMSGSAVSSFIAHGAVKSNKSEQFISIGHTSALSGKSGFKGLSLKSGIQTAFESINSEGGIKGKYLKLIALDDGHETLKTITNCDSLIEKDGVIGLVSTLGTDQSIAAAKIALARGVPIIGPSTGSQAESLSNNDFVYHIRASYAAEIKKSLNQFTAGGTIEKKIGVLHFTGSHGDEINKLLKEQAKIMGIKPAFEMKFNDSTSMPDIVKSITDAGVTDIIVAAYYEKILALFKEINKQKASFQVSTTSYIGPIEQNSNESAALRGLMVTQIVPEYTGVQTELVQNYKRDTKKFGDGIFSYYSLEGYISAMVVAKAARLIDGEPSPQKLKIALDNLSTSIGGYSVNFKNKNHVGSQYVGISAINHQGKLIN
jgi:ABC-type branched-subunit amino acid transport system substrate-binding protein